MRRRLTAKEIKDYNSTKCQDGETTLQFIKNLENMNQVWDKEIGNSLYLKSMKEFVDDDDFEYVSVRADFIQKIWIVDKAEDLPIFEKKTLSDKEVKVFMRSIVEDEDVYGYPEALNLFLWANRNIDDLSEGFNQGWLSGTDYDDADELFQDIKENFFYIVERLPEIKKESALASKVVKSEKKVEVKTTKKGNGEKKMINIFGEGFGVIEGMAISMMTGEMAIPGENGKFFTFNSKSKEITDVTDMVIEMELPAYAMPVGPETIAAGDIVRHNGQFLFVSSVTKAGKITGTKPDTAEEATIVPIKNAFFNQSFVAKVTTMNMFAGATGEEGETAKGPFGDMNPMMMMMMMKGKDGGSSMDKLLPLMMMQQGGLTAGAADGQMNPMMMMMMLMDKMN